MFLHRIIIDIFPFVFNQARVKRMKLGFDETDTPVENTDNSQQQQVEENDL